MFGTVKSVADAINAITRAGNRIVNAIRRSKRESRRDRAATDPAAEFQRRYGGLHPDLKDPGSTETGAREHQDK